MRRPGPVTGPALAYAAVCVGLWPVPVIGMVHAEGAAVVAALSFFVAGVAGAAAFARGDVVSVAARRHIALLLVPLALLAVTALWRPNCGWPQGLGLFALLVPPSTLLGLAVARGLVAFRVPRPRLAVVAIGVALALVPTVLTLKLRPQLFVYNVVYGGVLGPIYDAELSIRPGLFAHRALTVLWASGVLLASRWREGARRAGWGALGVLAVLVSAYVWSTPLGFTQSEANLRRALPGRVVAGTAVLHHAPAALAHSRAVDLAREVAFRTDRLGYVLGARPRDTVHVYLYPDPETKGALLGSRETSVVPVWLPSPQIHLLDARADGDLGHEVVHIVAREFGGTVTGASWKVGLVEGLAVALEPASGVPSPEQQTAAALRLPPEAGGLADPAGAIVRAMNPLGFWGGRAGVAYTTTGAFVGWLLETHGDGPVRAVYRGATWEAAFGTDLRPLAERWAAHLRTVTVSPEAEAYAAWRFAQPSLFEVACPHHVPRWRRAVREADDAWEAGDAPAAEAALRRALGFAPEDPTTRTLLATRAESVAMLAAPGRSAARLEDVVDADTSRLADPLLALARARRLAGVSGAFEAYDAAERALPPYALQARALSALEARLSPEALRALLQPRPDSLAAVRASGAMVGDGAAGLRFAALLRAEAGDAGGAWRLWREADDAEDPPGLGAAETLALDVLGARLALQAGDADEALARASGAVAPLRAIGRGDAADVAADVADRARWERRQRP